MHPTREKLLLTTVALLDSEHPDQIGQELVLSESGVSKGSMYHHFKDFSEVVEAALVYRFHRVVDENIETLGALVEESTTRDDFVNRLVEITRAVQDPERAPFRFERARALGKAGYSERFRATLGAEQQRLTDALTAIVERAQSRGLVQPDIDPRAVAVFIQAYTLGKAVDDITVNHMDEDAWVDLITRIIRSVLT